MPEKRKHIRLFGLFLFLFLFPFFALEFSPSSNCAYAQLEEDTLSIDDPLAREAEKAGRPDSTKLDTLTVLTAEGRKHKIVKRDFNARQQVVIGTSIMAFVILVLTMSANWNPE